MRSFVLAVLASAVVFSPALAQAQYGRAVPSRKAAYTQRTGASPVKYAGHTDVTGAQYVEATSYHGGHACGCSSCSSGCHQPIFGNLLDNAADLFISLVPCPRPCRGCVLPAHCCPYPQTSCDCTTHRTPLMNSLFPCHQGRCGNGCQSCAQPACKSCTTGAMPTHDLIAPPAPEVDTKSDPFQDDSQAPAFEGATRKPLTTPQAVKRTSATQRNWYKTTNRAPITGGRSAAPPVFVAEQASPIGAR